MGIGKCDEVVSLFFLMGREECKALDYGFIASIGLSRYQPLRYEREREIAIHGNLFLTWFHLSAMKW